MLMAMIISGHYQKYLTTPKKLFLFWYVLLIDLQLTRASTLITQTKDWWLSPELYLRRPCELYEDYRLDRVLKRRAEAGVKIYIVVYKEVGPFVTALTTPDAHSLSRSPRR